MFVQFKIKYIWSSLLTLLLISTAQFVYATDKFETGYFLGADNNKIFYRHLGKEKGKENIIYVHGGPGFDSTDGGYEFDDLAKNFHFIAYDQRGGGNSQIIEDPELLKVQHHINDLEALRKHFKFEKMTLMGMSWGTGLSLLYANQYPHRVERLILTAPMPLTYNMLQYRYQQTMPILNEKDSKTLATIRAKDLTNASVEEILADCEISVPLLFKRYTSPYTDWSKFKGNYCGPDPQGIKMRWKNNAATMKDLLNYDWRKIASNTNIPAFITEGALSSVPLSTTNEWAAFLPNSRLKYMKKSGHIIWLDDPQQVIKDVNVFMQGQWPENANILNPTHLDIIARYTFENNMVNAQEHHWFHPKTTGNSQYTSNRFNRANAALQLSSPKSAITVPEAKWYVNEKSWTISGWFNINNSSKDNKGMLTQGSSLNLSVSDHKLKLNIGDLSIISSNRYEYDKWQHIAISRDKDSFTLYVNAEQVGAGRLEGIKEPEGDFMIGNLTGKIDDIRMYARTQNAQQVSDIFRQLDTK